MASWRQRTLCCLRLINIPFVVFGLHARARSYTPWTWTTVFLVFHYKCKFINNKQQPKQISSFRVVFVGDAANENGRQVKTAERIKHHVHFHYVFFVLFLFSPFFLFRTFLIFHLLLVGIIAKTKNKIVFIVFLSFSELSWASTIIDSKLLNFVLRARIIEMIKNKPHVAVFLIINYDFVFLLVDDREW